MKNFKTFIFLVLLTFAIFYVSIPQMQFEIDNLISSFYYENHFNIPKEALVTIDNQEYIKSNEWGSVYQDGPSKLLPSKCLWRNGILHCKK